MKNGVVREGGVIRVEASKASSLGLNLRKKSPEESRKPVSEVVLFHNYREGQKSTKLLF